MTAPRRLDSVNTIRAYQRTWLAETRARALQGEPFVICNSDEVEEILAVFDIPVLVINYWNFVITARRRAGHFSGLLEARGYTGPHFFGLGLGATIDPDSAPWGGLPKPTLIIGSTRHESELKVTELWAREFGCPCYPLDFNFASPYRRLPTDDWWASIRDNWEQLVDPDRLELRVQENKALINYLELQTGRPFSVLGLREVMERVNAQMRYMTQARDLIAAARPCPVSLRDQMSAYQATWHRGRPVGLELARAYYDEVKARVESGEAAYPNQRMRLLYWSMAQEPEFHSYLQQEFGAAIVGAPYGAMPETYARAIVNDDPLRTLSARHIFLFDMRSPTWMVREARLYGVDAVLGVEEPSPYPSVFRQACEAEGVPYLAVPRVSADDEVLASIGAFMARHSIK